MVHLFLSLHDFVRNNFYKISHLKPFVNIFYFVLLSSVFLTYDSLYRLSHLEVFVNNFFIFLCVYVSGLIRRSASFDRASDIILNQSLNVNTF